MGLLNIGYVKHLYISLSCKQTNNNQSSQQNINIKMALDCVFNTLAMYLSFSFADFLYDKLCCCQKSCYKCCIRLCYCCCAPQPHAIQTKMDEIGIETKSPSSTITVEISPKQKNQDNCI